MEVLYVARDFVPTYRDDWLAVFNMTLIEKPPFNGIITLW